MASVPISPHASCLPPYSHWYNMYKSIQWKPEQPKIRKGPTTIDPINCCKIFQCGNHTLPILIKPMPDGVLPIQMHGVIHTLLKRQSHTREEATLE